MYKVCIYNGNVETILHYPTTDKTAPHLDKMNLVEKDNDVDTFSFSIPINNVGYTSLTEFKTKVKIIDTRDNSIRFTGRLLKAPEKMDSSGFYKEASCESALAYLLDTNARAQSYLTADISSALNDLLNRHNTIVEDSKKIYLGTVNVSGSIAYTCQYEPTLNAIINMLKGIECHLQVRETDGKLYLDCLKELTSRVVEIRLGENMKEMIKTYDPTSIGTRIIPLGANNLNISSVNNGLDYIDDETAKGLFGIIEKTVSYSDITEATELKTKVMADINNYTQPSLTFEINALDLSTLSGISADTFKKGLNLHIINPVMSIDGIYTIVEVDADLTQVYNPKLTISNIPTTIQDIISKSENNAVNNDSVHNGVQVGDSFGIRVSSSDGKIVITISALEGISIVDVVRNLKKFFVDTEGNLVLDGKQQVTDDNGNILMDVFKNSHGGQINVNDFQGNTMATVAVDEGTNTSSGIIVVYEGEEAKHRVELGVIKGKGGMVQVLGEHNTVDIGIYAEYGNSSITIDNQAVATQAWVQQHFQPKTS